MNGRVELEYTPTQKIGIFSKLNYSRIDANNNEGLAATTLMGTFGIHYYFFPKHSTK
jgi:hypothetical protein